MKYLEGKHEQFTSFLNDEEFDAAENWMSELQTLYRDATNLKNEYMDNIQFDESNARATREREELENQQREQNEKLKENILIKRSGARTLFDVIFSNATHILETENAATSLMKKVLAQLEEAFIECKLRNEQYLELIGKEMMEQELLWISNVQVLYSQIFEIFETRISEKEESKLSETTLCNSNSPGTANNVPLEKIKRPHFEGDIREYPQFKRDFQTQVMPGLTKLTAPYTLRTCLDKEALAQVKSVDDDIEEMWARLDEKFGDPGKVTDVIINDIKRFKVIREGESKKFVEFVDMIEDSYRDLKRLGIEKEITTTSSVSTIESKLPPDRFARLYAEYIHQRGHHGVSSTVSKIRARFWITNIQRMVRSIKYNCVICKKIDKQLCQQKMGKLPEERLKPSPPWHYTGIDLFGPFKIRDEVKRRTYGKCYGVIFNCMCTRAVHLDLAPDYSTETFLLVLRRFVSLRGYPAKLYSDNGPQLVAADKELKDITKNWNWDELLEFGVTEGLQWEFSPADAPWYNGTSEALIRSVKRSLNIAIGDNIMTFSELQTACFEVGNLINERPIGKHPTDTDDGVYLSPNDLLLGRSTSRVPSGPFRETTNPRHSLLIESKWHTAHRDVKVGDVVLIQDSNLRGNWKLGKVITTKPSKDGRVRRVEIVYKNTKPGEHVKTYRGGGYVTVERPVQRIIVIVPVDENEMKD